MADIELLLRCQANLYSEKIQVEADDDYNSPVLFPGRFWEVLLSGKVADRSLAERRLDPAA